MKWFFIQAWATAALASSSVSTGSHTQCTTKYCNFPRRIMPTIITHNPKTSHVTHHSTSTLTQTITPAPVTTTITTTTTSTDIVDTEETDTATITTTLTSTATATTTTTSTETDTSTTTTTTTTQTTTTVPTADGFTPLSSATDYMAKRSLDERRARATNYAIAPLEKDCKAPKQKPCLVYCGVTTTDYTTVITNRTVTSTLPASTVPVTSTASTTVTSTSTLAPTTISITTTTQTTTVITTTETASASTTTTSTATVVQAAATYYAQCASDNIVNNAFGVEIGDISYNSAFSLQSVADGDSSGVTCCNTCAAATLCSGFAYYPYGTCYYVQTDGSCNAADSFGDKYEYYDTGGPTYIVGNAQCGLLTGSMG